MPPANAGGCPRGPPQRSPACAWRGAMEGRRSLRALVRLSSGIGLAGRTDQVRVSPGPLSPGPWCSPDFIKVILVNAASSWGVSSVFPRGSAFALPFVWMLKNNKCDVLLKEKEKNAPFPRGRVLVRSLILLRWEGLGMRVKRHLRSSQVACPRRLCDHALGKLRLEGGWYLCFIVAQEPLLPATLAQRAWAIFRHLKAVFEVGDGPTWCCFEVSNYSPAVGRLGWQRVPSAVPDVAMPPMAQ